MIPAFDRLEKRLSESIVPEVRDRLRHHLEQTKGQQERLRERIKALAGKQGGNVRRRFN